MFVLPGVNTPSGRSEKASLRLRYEDIAQDRRVKLGVLPASLGVVWRTMMQDRSEEMKRLRADGIVPVLRRFMLVAHESPIGIQHPLDVEGRWETAHLSSERKRFVLNMRTDLSAPRASTYPPPPENAGAIGSVGGVFAEHVYTRIFAAPGERRIDRLPDGVDAGPERPWIDLTSLLRTDAETLDAAPVDRGEVLFGLTHTDSNQHVNSLVYPQLFEERALEAWGDGHFLARSMHVIWRKPCFAGERASVRIQRIRAGERRGAIALLFVDDETRPRCAGQLWLG